MAEHRRRRARRRGRTSRPRLHQRALVERARARPRCRRPAREARPHGRRAVFELGPTAARPQAALSSAGRRGIRVAAHVLAGIDREHREAGSGARRDVGWRLEMVGVGALPVRPSRLEAAPRRIVDDRLGRCAPCASSRGWTAGRRRARWTRRRRAAPARGRAWPGRGDRRNPRTSPAGSGRGASHGRCRRSAAALRAVSGATRHGVAVRARCARRRTRASTPSRPAAGGTTSRAPAGVRAIAHSALAGVREAGRWNHRDPESEHACARRAARPHPGSVRICSGLHRATSRSSRAAGST